MLEHGFLENIKKLYKYYENYLTNNKQYKAILETEMVSTSEEFTYKSPMVPIQYMTVKNSSAIKSLH